MRSLDHFNLRSFDLNLLLAFDALMQELNVTKAAARLRIQQPAMSHALSTLRLLLDDPLFVRVGLRMEPTARALALGDAIRRILHDVQEALVDRSCFDPGTARREIHLGVNVQMEAPLASALVTRLRAQAPGMTLVTTPVRREDVFDMLDAGAIDLGIGYLPGGQSSHQRARVADVEHVCCFSAKLFGSPAPIALTDYRRAAHGLLSAKNNALGYLEEAFERAGIVPFVVMSSPNFLTLARAAAQAPIVVTLSEGAARECAALFGLVVSPLPFEMPSHPVDMVWHVRDEHDPYNRWLRAEISDILRAA